MMLVEFKDLYGHDTRLLQVAGLHDSCTAHVISAPTDAQSEVTGSCASALRDTGPHSSAAPGLYIVCFANASFL